MILKIILVLFYLLAPAAVLYGCRRWRWMDKIGPILILYVNMFNHGVGDVQELLKEIPC